MRQKAKQILQQTDIDKLPSLPQSLLSLLEICAYETLPLERLAEILRHDPALHIRVCAAMHHAGIGIDGDSLLESLAGMDRNRLKAIATNAATQQFFSRANHERTDFIKQHWYHSLLCAHIAESLCEHTAYPYPDEVYKAGLLHDIGQLILEGAYPSKYTATFARLSEDVIFHNLEQEEFDTTHHEVGAECLRRHGCDPFISDAALYHHENPATLLDAHPIVKLVYIANLLSSDHFKEEDSEVFDAAEQLLGLARPLLIDALSSARERLDSIAESMEIELPGDGMDGDTTRKIASRDQNKHLQLAEQVRNIALLDSLHQYISYAGRSDIESIIREQCQLLFGVNSCLLFMYHPDDDKLHANTITTHNHLNEVAIVLEPNRSLITDALLKKDILNSFDYHYPDISVIDKQLIDLHSGHGIICIPMMLENAPLGTVVLVVDEVENKHLQNQGMLLKQFSQALAHILEAPVDAHSSDAITVEEMNHQMREIAHEVGNPLSVINNYLEVLRFRLESDDAAQKDIEIIRSEIGRIRGIMQGIGRSEQVPEAMVETDVNQLLSDMNLLFQSSLLSEADIRLEFEPDENLDSIESRPAAIKQIYTNLIKNAAEALPANGNIMVYTLDNVNVDGESYIEISIVDDGPGIPSEILPSLFSPVQTTKQGDHAGLGLSIVKNLISELNGSIRCQSSGKGTGFYILLPK